MASLATAILFGCYNIFAKLAAGRLSDSLAAFILEFSAAILVLGYIIIARSPREELASVTAQGIIYAVLGGLCVAGGSILYFYVFRMQAPLALAGSVVWAGATTIMIMAGLVFFGEKLNMIRALGLILTLAGITLLSLSANQARP